MAIYTKRWCDPKSNEDGWRILICRYRPRGLPKKDETWNNWFNQLAPSHKLHALAYGKNNKPPISWEKYCLLYSKEIKANKNAIALITCLAKIVKNGQNITLLCSSACKDATHCHRSLLKEMIEVKIVEEEKADKS